MSLPKSAASIPDRPAGGPGLGRLAIGLSRLSAAELFRVGISAGLSIYLARRLGAAAFGMWTFAVAVNGYPLALVEAGLTWIGTRDLAADPASARSLVKTIVSIRALLALLGVCGVAIVAAAVHGPAPQQLVVLLAGASLLTTATTLDWVFYGLERPSAVAAATVTRVIVFAAAALAIVRRPDQVWAVPLLQAAGEAAASLQLWIAFSRAVPAGPGPAAAVSATTLMRQAAPLTASQLMRAITIWSSTTIIGILSTASAVGNFGVAQRLTQFAGGFATLYFYGYLPLASRAAQQGAGAVDALVRASVRFTSLATLPFAVAITLLAEPLVLLLFGAPYSLAAPVLRILVWTIPISIMAGHFRHTLIAGRRTDLDLAGVTLGAAATLGLNLALVPWLGLRGGAVAMVAGEAVVGAAAIMFVARHVRRIVPIASVARAAAPSALMALAIIATRPRGLATAAGAGAVAYGVALLLLREVTLAQFAALARPQGGRSR